MACFVLRCPGVFLGFAVYAMLKGAELVSSKTLPMVMSVMETHKFPCETSSNSEGANLTCVRAVVAKREAGG